jgi:hypothetical protein
VEGKSGLIKKRREQSVALRRVNRKKKILKEQMKTLNPDPYEYQRELDRCSLPSKGFKRSRTAGSMPERANV